ncbi:MAG: carboxypeptidase-like regulatory domain-containing protein, partial [Chryseobacterium gambrini]|nr:carboxypeptidase-like regulatory domain-containing protein [Chryseobacterium gambrini]
MEPIIKKSLFPLFACCSIFITAQQQIVTGIVSDHNQPLPGAAVKITGSSKIIMTDLEGKFSVNDLKPGHYDLQISYIGFENQNITIDLTSQQTMDLGMISMLQKQKNIDEVIVTGSLKNSEARALNLQKNAINISNVIASDGIGKLPDRNAAETVQRVQGVSIERDQGEGRFVSLRGLPPFWASTTINGNRLPTAEEETTSRATAFDFFPTELISYVHVNKSFTPDMVA